MLGTPCRGSAPRRPATSSAGPWNTRRVCGRGSAGPPLVYATGGAAYGKVENRFLTTNGANSFTTRTDEDDADGTQWGGGVEWRLAPGLSVVGEYLYNDLETGDYVVRAGPGTAGPTNPFILPPNTAGTDITRSSSTFNFHAFRIGMNVRF